MFGFGYVSLGLVGFVGFVFGMGWVTVRSGSRSVHGQFTFISQSGHGDVRSGDGQFTVTVMSGRVRVSVSVMSRSVQVTVGSRSGHGHGQVTVRSRSRPNHGQVTFTVMSRTG